MRTLRDRAALVVACLALLVATLGVAGQPAYSALKAKINADTVDGFHAVKASAKRHKRAGRLVAADKRGRAPDAALLQGLPPGHFVTRGSKATDSDKLDGLDSTNFLRSDGKAVSAASADTLAGLGPSRFVTSPGGLTVVAAGAVSAAGVLSGGTAGVTVRPTAVGNYEITIAGQNYTFATHVSQVTLASATSGEVSTAQLAGGKLRVNTYNTAGTLANLNFHFVVFKLP